MADGITRDGIEIKTYPESRKKFAYIPVRILHQATPEEPYLEETVRQIQRIRDKAGLTAQLPPGPTFS